MMSRCISFSFTHTIENICTYISGKFQVLTPLSFCLINFNKTWSKKWPAGGLYIYSGEPGPFPPIRRVVIVLAVVVVAPRELPHLKPRTVYSADIVYIFLFAADSIWLISSLSNQAHRSEESAEERTGE